MKETHRFHSWLLIAAFAGLLLLTSGAQAQVLYVSQNEFNGTTGDGIISTVSSGGVVTPFADVGFGVSVYGMTVNSSGTLFAAVASSADYAIDQISPTGTVSTFVDFGSSGTVDPIFLAFGSNGDLYASNYTFLSPGKITEITPGGSVSTFTNSLPSGSNGIAFDTSGNLYVASGASTISEVTPGGTISTFASGLSGTYVLAFDSGGNLYSGNLADNSISKITPGGSISTFVSGGVFGHMEGIAFDAQGNLFVANGSVVSEVTPGGAVSTVATGLTNPNSVAYAPAAVPEPSTWELLTAGIVACLFVQMRRKKSGPI